MNNILFCGYRDWSKKIYKKLDFDYKSFVNLIYIDNKEDLNKSIEKYSPVSIFFVGWSWIIEDNIIDNFDCVCLHPSPLPKYRGGSPIQHQIINGEEYGAITLFKMDKGIDTGNILYQRNISLDGDLKDIFDRIVSEGSRGFGQLIDVVVRMGQRLEGIEQDESKATFYWRRKPKMSEINVSDFGSYTAKELHNKIRSLQNPYPNAYIKCKDGTKLYLLKSEVDNER